MTIQDVTIIATEENPHVAIISIQFRTLWT